MSSHHTFLFVMDAFETLNLETETSLLLMEDLLERGHEVLWAELESLILRDGNLWARAQPVKAAVPFVLRETAEIAIGDVDALLVRTDPPFDETYLHLTYLLDFVPDHVVQFNPAKALRSFNEKLTTLHFPGLAPPTLTTMNLAALEAFALEHQEIIVKPLGDCSGRGITKVGMENLSDLRALLQDDKDKPRFVTAQKFLTEVCKGDKRVYLVDGQPVGLVNRVPAEGSYLGNIHQGARCVETHLTDKERSAIASLQPFLDEHGIFLAGLDFIGGYLTEINITSPSAIRQINAVSDTEVHKVIVEKMLERVERSL